jgi:hypothetical protein
MGSVFNDLFNFATQGRNRAEKFELVAISAIAL